MPETTAQWVAQSAGRLREDGYRDAGRHRIGGYDAVVLRRADFRMQWALTRLHTMVLLASSDAVDAADLEGFGDEARRWAKRNKGGLPRGLQTGIAVLPVLAADEVTPAAVSFAERRPDKDFAAIALPMLVDVRAGRMHAYSGSLIWGAIYRMFLGEQQRLISAGLDGQTFQPDDSVKKSLQLGAVLGLLAGVVVLAGLLLLIFA